MESTFVRIVSESLDQRSLSLRRVARESGLDPSYLSKVLQGKRPPPTEEKALTRLARCLGISPTLLIVSTGTIPSHLRSLMEDPDFLRGLEERRSAGADPRGASRRVLFSRPPRGPREQRAADPLPTIIKSPTLSEDLL